VRDQLDQYVASGRLRLAGECCVELDQLLEELAGLRNHPFGYAYRKVPGTLIVADGPSSHR
jgi:hypothetical protein